MANPLETGLRYAGSVAERMIGMGGYQRESRIGKTSAGFFGLLLGLTPQILFPTTYEASRRFRRNDTMPLIALGGAAVDVLATIPAVILSVNGHPVEAILAKLTANAASHVGLDVLGAGARGMQRLKRNFRPSTAV